MSELIRQNSTPVGSLVLRSMRSTTGSMRGWLSELAQLTKLRITIMVAVTASVGFLVAGGEEPWLLAATLVCVVLTCMAASIFNQVMERRLDALMDRTKERPLPGGRVKPMSAFFIGVAFAVGGLSVAMLAMNWLATAFLTFTIVSYTLIYTPMKRRTSSATLVGAVPGAMPPVIGAVAVSGSLKFEAVLLFTIMWMWQLPHFLAIAWMYQDDFARAGYPVLPVLDPSGNSTFRSILGGTLILLPLGVLPTVFGVCGKVYLFGALALGTVFFGSAVAVFVSRSVAHARRLFIISLGYLPLIMLLMVVDRT